MRVSLGVLLSVVSGWAMAVATYTWDLPWLGLVAWVPAILGQHLVWPRRLQGWAIGLAWFTYLSLNFVPKLLPEIGSWVWALPVGVGALSILLEQRTVDEAQASEYRRYWWQNACSYTAVEFGRSFVPGVATWAVAGYSVIVSPGWGELAAYVGVFGLSLGVWAHNFALAYLILLVLGRATWRRGTGIRAALIPLLALILMFVPEKGIPSESRTLRTAAIQVGFDLYQGEWNARRLAGDDDALSRDMIAHGLELTEVAVDQGARLVVWPEGFLRVVPQDHPQIRTELEAFTRGADVTLAVGYVIETPDGRRNEVAMLTPQGTWHVTAKDHPVPWAETGSVTQGQSAVVTVDGYRVGAMICFDADFTDTTRERASAGLDLLVAPAHDWPAIGRGRAVHVRTRAAENRLPIVMADWMVGSAAVDERGRVLDAMPYTEETRGVMVVDVPITPEGPTPYGGIGDVVGWLSIAGTVLALVLGRSRR